MTVHVKICGVTNQADAETACAAGAAAIGFNFFPGSRRYVPEATAAEIVRSLAGRACMVGVFVDATRDEVERIANLVGLDALQFHGDENPQYCEGWSRKVIKAVAIKDAASVAAARRYATPLLLADAYAPGERGGTGKTFAWNLLAGLDHTRLVLAGGLTPDNVGQAVREVRPYAVDVASGVESAPGCKDAEKVRRFIANAHAA